MQIRGEGLSFRRESLKRSLQKQKKSFIMKIAPYRAKCLKVLRQLEDVNYTIQVLDR